MEDTSPFSLREGKLERSKTTRCLQRLEESLQTGSGCSNLHTMTHPWAKIWANLGLMDHLHTSWMTPMFRADFLHGTSKSVEVSPNLPPDDKNARARGAQAIYLQHC
jgi:hypothetical protein